MGVSQATLVTYRDMSRFEISGTMGRGKYSEVYEGIEIKTEK